MAVLCTSRKLDLPKMLKKPAEIVLGSFGVGLANIGLAESSFEKNSLDPYEIMARVHIGRKQPQVAYDFIADLGEKFRRNGQTHLLPNLNAFLVWIHLLRAIVQYRMKRIWLYPCGGRVRCGNFTALKGSH